VGLAALSAVAATTTAGALGAGAAPAAALVAGYAVAWTLAAGLAGVSLLVVVVLLVRPTCSRVRERPCPAH
jgi:ABC-type methionine transport system permease subunit